MWVGAAGNGVTGVRIHLNNHTTVTAAVGGDTSPPGGRARQTSQTRSANLDDR